MAADAPRAGRLTVTVAVLLAAATGFFLWGALTERSREHSENPRSERPAVTREAAEDGHHSEGTEQQEAGRTKGESPEQHRAEGEYRPLGINLESTPLLMLAAALSLALAGLVLRQPRREALVAVIAVAAGFTTLETAEVVHQANVDKPALLAIALTAGILHATAALLAARLLVPTPRHARPGTAG